MYRCMWIGTLGKKFLSARLDNTYGEINYICTLLCIFICYTIFDIKILSVQNTTSVTILITPKGECDNDLLIASMHLCTE